MIFELLIRAQTCAAALHPKLAEKTGVGCGRQGYPAGWGLTKINENGLCCAVVS